MKIFPITPLSNFDKIRNIYSLIKKTPKAPSSVKTDIVSLGNNHKLKKGRCICDMLSE